MVVIRLNRGGSKGRPFFNIVVADKRVRRDGRFIENIGMYDPNESPAKFAVNEDRWAHWTKAGAQPSETVGNLYKKNKAAPAAKA